jgi:hypothetical protein
MTFDVAIEVLVGGGVVSRRCRGGSFGGPKHRTGSVAVGREIEVDRKNLGCEVKDGVECFVLLSRLQKSVLE